MQDKYPFKKYVFAGRWMSYWHQINEVLRARPESVLVIGVGDGIVSKILKERVKKVVTLDIDKSLSPEIVASVENLPLSDKSFDVVLCAEVLEHLPFEKFEACLKELKRVMDKTVILSLPHFGPPFKFSFKIPFLKEREGVIKMKWPQKHIPGQHCWEIGKKGYSIKKIKKIIGKHFKINGDFIPFENQYHHFFILEKQLPYGNKRS